MPVQKKALTVVQSPDSNEDDLDISPPTIRPKLMLNLNSKRPTEPIERVRDKPISKAEDITEDPITSSILSKLAAKRTVSSHKTNSSPLQGGPVVLRKSRPDSDDDDDADPQPLFLGKSRFGLLKSASAPAVEVTKKEPPAAQCTTTTTVITKTYSFFKSKCLPVDPNQKKPLLLPPTTTATLETLPQQGNQYTRVKKTRDAFDCKERGDVQQFMDDLDYLLEGLSSLNDISTRVLTTTTLASKCLSAGFRESLTTHSKLAQIAKLLSDAHKQFSLALSASSLFYIISRDRDPKSIQPEVLQTMLTLLRTPNSSSVLAEVPTTATVPMRGNKVSTFSIMQAAFPPVRGCNKEDEKIRQRVKSILELIKQAAPESAAVSEAKTESSLSSLLPKTKSASTCGPGPSAGLSALNLKHLQPGKPLNARDLIIESLINLGQRKSSDWFKTQMRDAGGLDCFCGLICDSADYLIDQSYAQPSSLDALWRSHSSPQTGPKKPKPLAPLVTEKDGITGLDSFTIGKLRRVQYYMRVLENMTYMSPDNQQHLMDYKGGSLARHLVILIRLCANHLPRHPAPSAYWGLLLERRASASEAADAADLPAKVSAQMAHFYPGPDKKPKMLPKDYQVVTDCLVRSFRLLVNISQSELVSDTLGGVPDLLQVILDCLLHLPNRFPESRRYDLLVLNLCLLVNICQHCPEARARIVNLDLPTLAGTEKGATASDIPWVRSSDSDTTNVFEEVIDLFLFREELAKNHEFERDGESETPKVPALPALEEEDQEEGEQGDCADRTIEEAGLRWRLITPSSECRKRGQRQLLAERLQMRAQNNQNEDDEELSDQEEEDDEESDFDDEEDDECKSKKPRRGKGGADVEFVCKTKEEQEKLAQHMSSANQHMEDSVVAAYTALLLGCIMQTSARNTQIIRSKLPQGKFRPLAIMLAKLLSFLSLTLGSDSDSTGHESISKIIRILESQDLKHEQPNSSQ